MSIIDSSPNLTRQHDAPPAASRSTAPAVAERRLRQVLRANAMSSGLFGLVGLAGADYWSDRLGLEPVALTAALAIGLLVFAADVWWIASQPVQRLRPLALAVSAADLAWVAASITVVAIGVLTPIGAVVAIVVAVLVADFALTQLWFHRRLAGNGR